MDTIPSFSGFYRNKVEVHGIDPGALWRRLGDMMILVDQDQNIQVKWDPLVFTPVD